MPDTPPSTAAPNQASDALVNAIAAADHITPDQARQQIATATAQANAGTTFQPFGLSGNADTGTLWLGQTPASPGKPLLDPENLADGPGTNITFQPPGSKRSISIHLDGVNLHNGYTVDVTTDAPTPAQRGGLDVAPSDLQHFGVGIEIKDPTGKVIHTEWLNDDQKQQVFGFTPTMHAPGSPDVELQLDPTKLAQGALGGATKAADKTGTIGDQLKSIYSMPQTQLVGMKHELWLAGYYGTKPLAQIDMTTITNDDVSAFGSLMTAAARYFAAGQKITWQDLLSKQAVSDAVNAAHKPTVKLVDPAQVTTEANDTATKILGRAPSSKDVQTLIGLIQSKEASKLDADTQAGQPYIGTDPQADIEQFFRQKYPNEANATDWGDRAAEWEQLLRTPSVQQPQIVKPT